MGVKESGITKVRLKASVQVSQLQLGADVLGGKYITCDGQDLC